LWIVLILSAGIAAGQPVEPLGFDDGEVCDNGGRRIAVSRGFSRVISLYGAHTENLLNLGAAGRLVGIDGQSEHLPGASGKPVFSYHDDPERFLAARPDLVVIRPMIERGYPRLVQRLRQSGIVVVSVQPTTVAQLDAYWLLLGRLCGQTAEAEEMIHRFHRAVAQFKVLSGAIKQGQRVYFEAMHSKMKTFAPTAMAIFALETAGGINVAADAPVRANNNIAVYGKERLLSHAEEIDVFLSQQGAMNQVTVAQIMAEPGFKVIKAVKTGRVYLVDETIVSRPTMRLIKGIHRIGCLLYPDLYDEAGPRILTAAGLENQ
jgi:iron complex transport system substrate-binding protein